MEDNNFKVWPIGKLPREWQRPELEQLRANGCEFEDPREVVSLFEQKLARYAGAPHAVAVDNCTDAVFLCLQHLIHKGELSLGDTITIPKRCYLSVPMAVKLCGLTVAFEERAWSGTFQLKPTQVHDGAVRFTEGMYIPGALQCTSFQIKKRLPIGKGGMIFTDDEEAETWFRQASFEGRHLEKDQWHDEFEILGWNMYMTPEDAARGLLIFDQLPRTNEDSGCQDNYPDLSTQKIFRS